jgi:hypothetical protein
VKKMNTSTVPESRLAHCLAHAVLAFCAAAILVAASLLNASAAVNIVKVTAVWQTDDSILVAWETSSELESVAFFLYRAESKNGPWEEYIDFEPATGNDFTGATYSFVDTEVTRGVDYWYRLEELASDDSSSFYGPYEVSDGTNSATATATATTGAGSATATATRSATSKPTSTVQPGRSANPTATRQYTLTPTPAGAGASAPSPAQTQSPKGSGGSAQPASTRSSGLMVTTPTPVGGAPAVEEPGPTPEITVTPEGGQPEPTAGQAGQETLASQPTLPAPTSSPTPQQIAAAPKETSQPLLDASATQGTSAPAAEAPRDTGANSRLALLLGIGALAVAAILGALVLLIWRRRGR